MVNNIITYLMIGVAFNWIFDLLTDHLKSDNKLTIKEKFIVTVIWPIGIIMFIYHFAKTFINGSD